MYVHVAHLIGYILSFSYDKDACRIWDAHQVNKTAKDGMQCIICSVILDSIVLP